MRRSAKLGADAGSALLLPDRQRTDRGFAPIRRLARLSQCHSDAEELSPLFPDALTAMLAWEWRQRKRHADPKHDSFAQAQEAGWLRAGHHRQLLHAGTISDRSLSRRPDTTLKITAFSRAPFPVAFSFDPCGLMWHGFLARYAVTLRQQPVPPEGRNFLTALRGHIGADILQKRNPFTRAQISHGKNFQHLILLPLQVGQSFAFEGQGTFTSQLGMLEHVLTGLQPTIGVVVTEHSDWERSLTPEVLADLRARFPHFLYSTEFDDYLYPAQFLLPLVDGVATLSSSVGLQALLWHKPNPAPGQSQINAVADCTTLEHFPALLETGLNEQRRAAQDALLLFCLRASSCQPVRIICITPPGYTTGSRSGSKISGAA